MAALRTEILRTRYRLAEAAAREEQLLDARDKLRVTVRELRDPVRLSKLATDLGFGAPERVIDLDLPRGPGGGS